MGMLQDLNCYQNNADCFRYAKVFGVYRKDELTEMADISDNEHIRKQAISVVRVCGKYAIIGLPCWDGSSLVGLWLIHNKVFDTLGFAYLPLQAGNRAVGLGHLVRATDDIAFVTNDPRVSLRYMIRQMWTGDRSSPYLTFLCPGPRGERRVIDTGARETIYVPCDANGQNQLEWLKLAVQSTGASTVMTWKMREPPLVGFPASGSRPIAPALKNLAVPAHQALGSYLLSRPLSESAKHVSWLNLSTSDQNLVRTYFTGDDARTLERLFDTVDRPKCIDYRGKRIVESKAGWKIGDIVLSSAIIRIDQSETDKMTGRTTIEGTISVDGKLARFREDLAVIKKNQAEWLDTYARVNMNCWPRIDAPWARHLIDIAYLFSADTARIVSTDRPFGWDTDNVLRFPRFLVDATGVTRTNCSVLGPNVTPPDQTLSPAHFDALSDKDFCFVSLALIGNLLRTQAGFHGYGLLLPSAPHVVERLADALGLPMTKNASIQDVMTGENRPLPLAGVWQDDKFAALLKIRGPKNILTSVDARSFQLLSAEPEWVRLPVDALASYDEIRWIYHAIPRLMRASLKPTDERFFSPIALALADWVYPHCMKHQLLIAAAELDSQYSAAGSKGSQGSQLVTLLRRLHDSGLLPAETDGELVRIKFQDVLAAFASPILPQPDIARMTATLADAKMLLSADRESWALGEALWSLTGSYLKTQG